MNGSIKRAPRIARSPAECASRREQVPDFKWCREGGSNPHGLAPKGFGVLAKPGTNGIHRSPLEPVQQLGCLDVVAHLAHGAIWKLMVLAQN